MRFDFKCPNKIYKRLRCLTRSRNMVNKARIVVVVVVGYLLWVIINSLIVIMTGLVACNNHEQAVNILTMNQIFTA